MLKMTATMYRININKYELFMRVMSGQAGRSVKFYNIFYRFCCIKNMFKVLFDF